MTLSRLFKLSLLIISVFSLASLSAVAEELHGMGGGRSGSGGLYDTDGWTPEQICKAFPLECDKRTGKPYVKPPISAVDQTTRAETVKRGCGIPSGEVSPADAADPDADQTVGYGFDPRAFESRIAPTADCRKVQVWYFYRSTENQQKFHQPPPACSGGLGGDPGENPYQTSCSVQISVFPDEALAKQAVLNGKLRRGAYAYMNEGRLVIHDNMGGAGEKTYAQQSDGKAEVRISGKDPVSVVDPTTVAEPKSDQCKIPTGEISDDPATQEKRRKYLTAFGAATEYRMAPAANCSKIRIWSFYRSLANQQKYHEPPKTCGPSTEAGIFHGNVYQSYGCSELSFFQSLEAALLAVKNAKGRFKGGFAYLDGDQIKTGGDLLGMRWTDTYGQAQSGKVPHSRTEVTSDALVRSLDKPRELLPDPNGISGAVTKGQAPCDVPEHDQCPAPVLQPQAGSQPPVN